MAAEQIVTLENAIRGPEYVIDSVFVTIVNEQIIRASATGSTTRGLLERRDAPVKGKNIQTGYFAVFSQVNFTVSVTFKRPYANLPPNREYITKLLTNIAKTNLREEPANATSG